MAEPSHIPPGEHPAIAGLRWLANYQAPIRDLLRSYMRFRAKEFFFVSQGPFGTSARLSFLIFVMSLLVSLAVGIGLLFSIGASAWEAGWNVIRTGVVFVPITILPLYLVLRYIAGIRAGTFLINFVSISNAIWFLALCAIMLIGVVLSGSLARDITEIHAGRGRSSAVFEVLCKPLDLQIEEARLLQQVDDLTSEFEILGELQTRVEAGEITDRQAQHLFNSEVERGQQRLSALQRVELALLRAERRAVTMELRLTPSDRAYDYFMSSHLPVLIAVGVGLLIVLPVFMIWNVIFFFRAILGQVEGQKKWRAAAAAVAGSLASLAVGYGYVSFAEGLPDWDAPLLSAHIQDLQVKSRHLELICGQLDSRGLW